MRVEELMTEAKGCREGDTVRKCAMLMRDEDIGFVPVCNQAGEPIGAITDRDLTIRVLASGLGGDEKIDRFITRQAIACRVGDDVHGAQQLMRDHQLSRVMVCDPSGKLQGVISLADIADVESDESLGDTLQHVKSDGQPSMH